MISLDATKLQNMAVAGLWFGVFLVRFATRLPIFPVRWMLQTS